VQQRACAKAINAVCSITLEGIELSRLVSAESTIRAKIRSCEAGIVEKLVEVAAGFVRDLLTKFPVELVRALSNLLLLCVFTMLGFIFRMIVFGIIDVIGDTVACPECTSKSQLFRNPYFMGKYSSIIWVINTMSSGLNEIADPFCKMMRFFGYRGCNPNAAIPFLNTDNWGSFAQVLDTRAECHAFANPLYEMGTGFKILSSALLCLVAGPKVSTYPLFNLLMFRNCSWSSFHQWCFALFIEYVFIMLLLISCIAVLVVSFKRELVLIYEILASFFVLLGAERRLRKVRKRIKVVLLRMKYTGMLATGYDLQPYNEMTADPSHPPKRRTHQTITDADATEERICNNPSNIPLYV
jgi:hypothetical protein